MRASAVAELARLLDTAGPGMARTAQQVLRQVAEQDVPAVAAVARAALRAAPGEATRAVAAAAAGPPVTGTADPMPPAEPATMIGNDSSEWSFARLLSENAISSE